MDEEKKSDQSECSDNDSNGPSRPKVSQVNYFSLMFDHIRLTILFRMPNENLSLKVKNT
jgi:hypothetical protein